MKAANECDDGECFNVIINGNGHVKCVGKRQCQDGRDEKDCGIRQLIILGVLLSLSSTPIYRCINIIWAWNVHGDFLIASHIE